VLRGKVPVQVGDTFLKVVCQKWPFQFPTRWSEKGRPRYVDALLRDGEVPYFVELKVGTASMAQYFRHAVTQVVLYREFIRKALLLHPWFEEQGLDAKRCRAIVAFPKKAKSKADDLSELRALAGFFDVEIVELNDP